MDHLESLHSPSARKTKITNLSAITPRGLAVIHTLFSVFVSKFVANSIASDKKNSWLIKPSNFGSYGGERFIQKNEKETSTKKKSEKRKGYGIMVMILLGKRRKIKSKSKLVGSF